MMKSFHARRARAGGGALAIALVALCSACSSTGSDSGAGAVAAGDGVAASTSTALPPAPPSDPAAGPTRSVADSSASARAPRTAGPANEATRPAPASTAPAAAQSSERSSRRVVVQGVDLTGVGYDKGSPSAPVVVVNFSDFGCPFCGSFARQTQPEIEKDYVQTGKVFFKYVPFVMGMFPNGDEAAHASECAAGQGRFWAMHDALYASQTEWKKARDPVPAFNRYAKAAGLDVARFAKCYAVPEVSPGTMRANIVAGRLGIRVTPSFVVNGKGVEGALPLPQFRQLLDAALKEAR
jgi:protein-disulfide isomerase